MKYIKTILAIAILFLTGCASTTIKDSSLKKRTTSFSILGVINWDSTTEDLVIGEVGITKE